MWELGARVSPATHAKVLPTTLYHWTLWIQCLSEQNWNKQLSSGLASNLGNGNLKCPLVGRVGMTEERIIPTHPSTLNITATSHFKGSADLPHPVPVLSYSDEVPDATINELHFRAVPAFRARGRKPFTKQVTCCRRTGLEDFV
jgi:hypothetical protein